MLKTLWCWLLGLAACGLARYTVLNGYGMNGYLGLGKETTWGTAVAPTDFIESMSENLSTSIDRFDVANIINALYEQDDMDGVRRVAGDIVFAADPVFLGNVLKAAMNTLSGSIVLSGFLYLSRFVTPQADFASGVAGTPYTLEVFRDVTSAHRYAGCVLDKLGMTLAPNQDMRVTASWIGKSPALAQKTAPTFTGSPVNPFAFDTASLQLAGSATARIEAMNVRVDNQLVGVPALNGTTQIARVYRRGPQLVTIGGTIDFQDVMEYLDFINQTERAFVATVTRANSFALSIVVPRFVYTAFPMAMPGRDRLTVQFAGKARYLTTSATAIDFQLTSTKSNY